MTPEKRDSFAVDKSGWPRGEWNDEPDRVDFRFEGLPCLLLRSRLGNWCGYVGLPPGHPHYGESYMTVDVQVHGGLTYGEKCAGNICHVPEPGEPDEVYWLGFDCAHSGDRSPGIPSMGFGYESYRPLSYVRHETESLARQLAEAKCS